MDFDQEINKIREQIYKAKNESFEEFTEQYNKSFKRKIYFIWILIQVGVLGLLLGNFSLEYHRWIHLFHSEIIGILFTIVAFISSITFVGNVGGLLLCNAFPINPFKKKRLSNSE